MEKEEQELWDRTNALFTDYEERSEDFIPIQKELWPGFYAMLKNHFLCKCESGLVGGPVDPQHTEPIIHPDCPLHTPTSSTP